MNIKEWWMQLWVPKPKGPRLSEEEQEKNLVLAELDDARRRLRRLRLVAEVEQRETK